MTFHKIFFIFLLLLAHRLPAQVRQLELSGFHEQVTLPFKSLPSHKIHPGLKLSYLTKENANKRWLKEIIAGYFLHEPLFRAVQAGYGYRYGIVPPKKPFQLQAGMSAGALMLKSTEPAYKIIDGKWEQTEASWKAEGWISIVLKASYQLPNLPAFHAGAGINVWAQTPHVEQFTIVLPHRNYEIFIRYNFNNTIKTTKR
ncbi:MAG: hypothetical protein H7Y86_16710 [Rhizobacter sp.]|nr:hypothetical protein [Ferruginibacter sp.]